MPTPRAVRPVKQPAGATGVLAETPAPAKISASKPALQKAVVKKPAKPISKKRRVRKKPAAGRPISKQRFKARSLKVRAAVLKRKATMAATGRSVDAEPVPVEPGDEVARAAIDKRQVGGRRTAVERAADPPPAAGIALIERVTRAVERELSQIEVIVGGHHVRAGQRTEAERRARTLASLARTLTEVRKLRADEHKVKPQDDDDGPRDIEEFRLVLFQKLDRLAAEAKALHAGEADGAGDGGHHLVVEAVRPPPPDTAE